MKFMHNLARLQIIYLPSKHDMLDHTASRYFIDAIGQLSDKLEAGNGIAIDKFDSREEDGNDREIPAKVDSFPFRRARHSHLS